MGASFFEDVPLVLFTYVIFTRILGGEVKLVGDSGLCCVDDFDSFDTLNI